MTLQYVLLCEVPAVVLFQLASRGQSGTGHMYEHVCSIIALSCGPDHDKCVQASNLQGLHHALKQVTADNAELRGQLKAVTRRLDRTSIGSISERTDSDQGSIASARVRCRCVQPETCQVQHSKAVSGP
jgi:hypothetical protein